MLTFTNERLDNYMSQFDILFMFSLVFLFQAIILKIVVFVFKKRHLYKLYWINWIISFILVLGAFFT